MPAEDFPDLRNCIGKTIIGYDEEDHTYPTVRLRFSDGSSLRILEEGQAGWFSLAFDDNGAPPLPAPATLADAELVMKEVSALPDPKFGGQVVSSPTGYKFRATEYRKESVWHLAWELVISRNGKLYGTDAFFREVIDPNRP